MQISNIKDFFNNFENIVESKARNLPRNTMNKFFNFFFNYQDLHYNQREKFQSEGDENLTMLWWYDFIRMIKQKVKRHKMSKVRKQKSKIREKSTNDGNILSFLF